MTATINRRKLLLLGALTPGLALQSALHATAADDAVRLSITLDENIDAAHGAAELIVDGDKQGILSAGCCMFVNVTPGQHELVLKWDDTTVTKVFEAKAGQEVLFHLSADRELTQTAP